MYLWGWWLDLLQDGIDSGKKRWLRCRSDNVGRHPLFFWVVAHIKGRELGAEESVDLERLRPMEGVGAKHVDGLDDAIREEKPKALQSIVVVRGDW